MTAETLHPWRVLYWEPVADTGERWTAGIVYRYGDVWQARRILPDDMLACLYGKAATGARKLIDTGLSMFLAAACAAQSLDTLGVTLFGLTAGPLRATGANSEAELLRTAAVLYSSLANLDKIDALDESDAPTQEESVRRFATDVREQTLSSRPDLAGYFGRTAPIIQGGEAVRFGYASTRLIAHFNVLNPMRAGASLRDSRARMFELDKGRALAQLRTAALIAGTPPDDDPLLGNRQIVRLREMREELAHEAAASDIELVTVATAADGAARLLALESA